MNGDSEKKKKEKKTKPHTIVYNVERFVRNTEKLLEPKVLSFIFMSQLNSFGDISNWIQNDNKVFV